MSEFDRYHVCSAGRSGYRAYVCSPRGGEAPSRVVMTLTGPDRFEVAAKIAAVLNESKTERPVDEIGL